MFLISLCCLPKTFRPWIRRDISFKHLGAKFSVMIDGRWYYLPYMSLHLLISSAKLKDCYCSRSLDLTQKRHEYPNQMVMVLGSVS